MKRPEILAPAGDLTKLQYAVRFGADAVYIGGEAYSLRTAARGFDREDMARGIDYAHRHGAKVYLAANIIAENDDLEGLAALAQEGEQLGADGIIVADPGAMMMVREAAPSLPIHVSTQANTLNYATAQVWQKLGAKRVVLARELSGEKMREIREKTDPSLELEAFVHGAMCISFSGRCLMSHYMTERSSNRGACSHPCRWNYALMEEKRPGEYFPVMETERGAFFFNSKDLCLIGRIPQLVAAGIDSFKIEGRVKSEYYVAAVVKAYREELDRYLDNPDAYRFSPEAYEELCKVSHREYSVGFFDGKPLKEAQIYGSSSYLRDYDLIATVTAAEKGGITVEQRNKFSVGDVLEVLQPESRPFSFTVTEMKNSEGEEISSAPHAQMTVHMPAPEGITEGALLRRERKGEA